MKNLITIAVLTTLVVSLLVMQPGCSRNNGLPVFSGNTTGIIHVDYVNSYENLGELAADADLIAIGTIDRTIEVISDKATGDQTYLTRSAFRVERVVKGDADEEIIISQTGAIGWAEEVGNPIFKPGERYFLFLRDSLEGIHYLVNPLGRYAIKSNNVYSMNYILPTGQSRPPQDLMYRNINLEEFISRVTKEMPY